MPTIDNLDIQISSSVNHANASLTTLIKRLDRVSASLSGVNSRGLATMGSGINKLSNAMANFSANTRTADFTRLATNLGKLSTIDTSAFGKMASGIASISNSLSKIPNIGESAEKFGELASGISKLGYKASIRAVDNIPRLAIAMRQLMATLSTAPRVSQNLIDMTNALAKLARTGASSGRATNSLAKSLNVFSSSAVRARKSSFSLASAIGKLYATYWLLFRLFGKLGDAIDISSSLTEVENVVNVSFGKYRDVLDKFADTSIQNFGISELDAKTFASRFQAMGIAMGFAQGKMANMSVELTKLTGDYASFYDVALSDVAEDFQSIFTGQTRPLRAYGLDLTEATLKEWAMRQGMEANIDTMSQMEKTMLRYQYVMANSQHIMGDFLRTSDSWHNITTTLTGNLKDLASTIGGTLINALKPLLVWFNNAIVVINKFAETLSNALGKIFGWKYEVGGGITNDLESGAEFAEDIAGGLGTASDNAKKLKSYLLGIDELNVIEPVDTDSISGGAGVGGAYSYGNGGQWVETESLFYESDLDTLYKLGDYISGKLSKAMENVKWDSVYKKAKNFGKGLANFLNGLISPRLFGNLGSNIAGSLNTALEFLNSFGETFEWEEFGGSLATGIKDFFVTWDAELTGETLSTFATGILEALKSSFDTLSEEDIFYEIGQKIVDLICGIEWGTLLWDFSELFDSMTSALKDFPADMAKGIIDSIASKIMGEEVNIEFPEWLQDALFLITFRNNPTTWIPKPEDIATAFDAITKVLEDWWNNDVTPWFTKEKWETLFENIKTSLNSKWAETVNMWRNNLKDWWEKQVAKWFKKEDWDKLLDVIPDSFEDAFNTAKEWVSSKIEMIYNTISGWIDNIKLKIAEIKDAFTGLGGLGSATLGFNIGLNTQGFATGGFPNSADIFYANENGVPELVGTIGHRTAVASGTEITGISDAVYRTGADQSMLLQNAVGLLQTSIGLLQDIADKELTIGDREVAKANARGQRSMGYTLITEG